MLSPRLLDLKEVQLLANCRAFVTPKHKDKKCSKDSEDVIERVKMQRKEKNKVRKDSKKTKDGSASNEASVLAAAQNPEK